jgi:hypothetical protein
MSITITRPQREVLWENIVTDLNAIGDIYVALHDEQWAKARALRMRFEADWRLLDDIGWARHDPGERFELTIPREELKATIERLQADAERFVIRPLLEGDVEQELRRLRTHAAILDQLNSSTEPGGGREHVPSTQRRCAPATLPAARCEARPLGPPLGRLTAGSDSRRPAPAPA